MVRQHFRMGQSRPLVSIIGVLATFVTIAACATDWPQWQGPDRTNVSRETGLLKSWPAAGPRQVWKAENLGEGYSTPSIANGRIYGLGLRGNDEVIWCLNESTGKEAWSTKIADKITLVGQQGQNGSRGTPTIENGRLYAIGVAGDLVCLDAATGKPVWRKSFVNDFGGRVPMWGYSESPLIDGEKVVVTPGSAEATIVALNKMTGDVIWKSSVQPGRASYSSCIVCEVGGRRQYVQFLATGVVGVDAKTGAFLWRYDSPANRNGICCSTPIFRDNCVFAASSYQTGGGLCKLTPTSDGIKAEEVYFTRQMKNHHGGMVLVGDYLYGFDERELTCIEWKTGNIKWTDRSVAKGSVTFADGCIYARGEGDGAVALVEATPSGYVEKSRFVQPDRTRNPAWAHPVIANGKLYLRDQDILLCYDVKGK